MSEQIDALPQVQLSDFLPPDEPSWKKDHAAFRRMLPELLKTHKGQYAAIYQGQFIDSGPDQIALVRKIRARLGNVPLHVGLVTDEVRPPERLVKYREVRQEPA
jgi:hypothetical protein